MQGVSVRTTQLESALSAKTSNTRSIICVPVTSDGSNTNTHSAWVQDQDP